MMHDLQAALAPSELGVRDPKSPGHYGNYEFHQVAQRLQSFCSEDLGGFYLDILKDRLYTAPAKGPARRAAQNALYHITQALTRLMAPILSFTAEEVWATLQKSETSVFEQTWYPLALPADADALRLRWGQLRALRSDVQKELETLRAAGKIGSSLAGEVDLYAQGEAHDLLASLNDDVRFVMITSRATLHAGAGGVASSGLAGVGMAVVPSTHAKCDRCWHYRPDVGANTEHAALCGRCVSNLFGPGEAREHA
jgi:isoleucyl-tRNA synthetase